MAIVHKSLIISAENIAECHRLDLAVRNLSTLSREQVRGLLDHNCVKLNGSLNSEAGTPLSEGDRVDLSFDPHQRYHPKKKIRGGLGFGLVFEDRHLIVVEKPAELLTVPTPKNERGTLLERVATYVKLVSRGKGAFQVHRLDRGVSGLLIFGKTTALAQTLRDQFAMHKPEREYVTIVRGKLEQQEGTFESLLATDRDLNRYSTDDETIGQHAITHYRVVETLAGASVVQVWLETGRRNQIRVHFAEAGHPVIGDPRYEAERAADSRWPHQRIALHARLLGLTHPITGEALRFESPLPAEMKAYIREAKRPAK